MSKISDHIYYKLFSIDICSIWTPGVFNCRNGLGKGKYSELKTEIVDEKLEMYLFAQIWKAAEMLYYTRNCCTTIFILVAFT